MKTEKFYLFSIIKPFFPNIFSRREFCICYFCKTKRKPIFLKEFHLVNDLRKFYTN